MPLRDRELITPPPSLASLQELSGPAVIAMLIASAIAVLDGLVGRQAVLIGLLAIPPVIAAMSASLPETGVVGAFCLVLAVLSILWHRNVAAAQYVISVVTVMAGFLAGLWVASLRVNLNREQAASELLAEAGALMEDALDRRARAQHLADLAVPSLGDVALIDILTSEGSIERIAARSRGTEVADIFVKLRADTPIDPHGPHPVAEVIRTGRTKFLDRLSDQEIDRITTRENEREHAPPASVPVLHRAPARRPRIGSRRHDPVDHAAGQGLRRDRPTHREAARRQGRPRTRQRPPARAAGPHRLGPPAQPVAALAARDHGLRAWPPASRRPARHTRSAATSTTSSAAATAAGRR